ncbi:hypothetical protein M8J77_016890 [Diaphorina citri]|nr:hypothetical protein M8J77_016890 [Diaphorina citri]
MNEVLRTGKFPDEWKVAKVVLILKPGKPELEPSSYRPLCLLDTYGKFLESMLTNRLNEELGEEGLSPNQFGFRRGRSTIDAIEKIYNIADEERRKPPRNRKLCLLLAFDVKNAFNSAPWKKIVEQLEKKQVPPYLTRVYKSYLEARKVVMGNFEMEMTAGVPQGSVNGPALWNVLYDGVLELQMPHGVHLIAYADDLAMVVIAKTEEEIELNANTGINRICEWMDDTGLQLAPEKTEATLLVGRKRCRISHINLMGTTINIKESLKYLGVILDKKLTFRPHIEYIAEKASKAANSLIRIMPRQGGASVNKRRLLNNVVESTILYASPVWGKSLQVARNRKKLEAVQRIMLLRICRTYRTVSTEALQVIAGVVPIDLLVDERTRCYSLSREEKEDERILTHNTWQDKWSNAVNGEWTRRLIPNIGPWRERQHGDVSFHMAQILSGHGCFQAYLKRFNKINSDRCMFCEEADTAEHTFFSCSKWTMYRAEMEREIGQQLTVGNLCNEMLKSERNWEAIARCMNRIMKDKEAEERRRKEQNSTTNR